MYNKPPASLAKPDVRIPDVSHVCHANVVMPDFLTCKNSQWEMNEAVEGKQGGTVVRNSGSTKPKKVIVSK